MEKVYNAVYLVTAGVLIFTILCSPLLTVPFPILFLFLLILQGGLIWMVITILKKGTPSNNTFDEKFYDDSDSFRN